MHPIPAVATEEPNEGMRDEALESVQPQTNDQDAKSKKSRLQFVGMREAANSARLTITEVSEDLFQDSGCLAHCVSQDLRMEKGIALEFRNRFCGMPELQAQRPAIGKALVLKRNGRFIFYLITKAKHWEEATLFALERALRSLKTCLEKEDIKEFHIPRLGTGTDGLLWHDVRNVIERMFRNTVMTILVHPDPRLKESKEGPVIRSSFLPKFRLGATSERNPHDKRTTTTTPTTECLVATAATDGESTQTNLTGDEQERLKPVVQELQGLTEAERKQGMLFLKNNLDCFSDNGVGAQTKPGSGLKGVLHEIKFKDPQAPPFREIRPLRGEKMENAQKVLNDMIARGVVRESSSPWCNPVHLVRKKTGEWRFCIDFRRLNSLIIKDSFPLPRIEDLLIELQGSKWFSAMDASAGYWQIGLEESSKEKTAFTLGRGGLWEHEVMAFGLCNAPATFQRAMENHLKEFLWKFSLVYIDDIIVYSKTWDEHLQHLTVIFEALRKAGVMLKMKKCHFFQRELPYPNHLLIS